MPEESSDLYEQLLTEWQARRTLVDVYHRSLRFLMAHNGDAPKQQQELIENLGVALTALRQASDQMRAYQQDRVTTDHQ